MGYRLKITIKNSHPPIWRRILIPDHITFFDLDDIIEAAFGWEHNHLFAFHFKDSHTEFVGTPIPEDSDTAHACIDPWIKEGISFTYTYDFGDNWIHTVKVEKIIPYDERYPQVLKSKGPNMIEDCGGIWGFYNCINEAEPFDLEAVNSDFKNWSLPETNPESEPYDFDPDLDEWEIFENLLTGLTGENKENQKQMEEFMMEMKHQEQEARQAAPPLLSLEDVFLCYSKDEMKQIACYYGFTGYNKFNKKELAQWLKNHLLDTGFMKKQWLNASEDEIHLFEAAITEQGITMSEDLLGNCHLLMTYGGFDAELDFYQVPADVQEKYKKICTPEFLRIREQRQTLLSYCDAAIYLYGMIPLEKLTELYNSYENSSLAIAEVQKQIQEFIAEDEPYILKEGFLMDEDLEEEDLFRHLYQQQQSCSYYLPDTREEFLSYGEYECQQPNEDTGFFLEYLQKKHHKRPPKDLMLFYQLQDGIRMNASPEELMNLLLYFDCKLSSQKQMQEAENQILKLERFTRKWDYRGHTLAEIQKDHQPTRTNTGKIYPNDPCPCGSGKKYKHCCGR